MLWIIVLWITCLIRLRLQGRDCSASTRAFFKQSELNEIVGRAKHDAVESFKRQQQTQSAQQAPQSSQAQSSKSLSEDDVKRLTSEELARQRDQWTREAQEKEDAEIAHRIVGSYKEKIAPGKEKYEDFEAVTNNVDMRYYPNVVQLLAEYVDNSHDVIIRTSKEQNKTVSARVNVRAQPSRCHLRD